MNKMKKLLSVVLAVVLALSAFSIMGSAAVTKYKTVAELEALDAYSPYGQVTRLSAEERTSIVFDALDNLLASLGINMGTVIDVLGLKVTINLTSIDNLCISFDSIKSTFNNTLFGAAKAFLDLGVLESLNVDKWETGMSRGGTANYHILSVILNFLDSNTNLVNTVLTNGLDLGIIGGFLGDLDLASINDMVKNVPGLIKGLVYPMIERWDDTLSLIQEYDNSIAGTGKNVEAIANMRVKKLFSDNMSITTIKYDANGDMTSEHTDWLAKATGSAAPGKPSANSARCYYQFSSTTPGSVMTVYHIVDAKEAKDLAKTPDKVNGSPAAYTYFKEAQTFVMSPEVEGSETYVWKATDEWNNTWSLKWYNDESPFLPGFDGDDFDLTTMSAGDLLYTFIPVVFKNMAPVVLNGSVKKALAAFVGVEFTYVGQGGPEADDAVLALPDASDAFFTQKQGEYLWEWSDYKVINGNHYYRFEDQIFAGDTSNKNNYFDIINWDFKVTDNFMDEFVPANDNDASVRLLNNVTKFLNKVGNLVLKETAETADTRTPYTATWVRPDFSGNNADLVENIKELAQAIVGLAPQHIFGDDYATNERCYVELMLAGTDKGVSVPNGMKENDVILTGIAAHLVDMIMPSMSLPGKTEILNSGAKVGAILAAVVREFAAYLAPEYNFDALIYTSFDNGTKTFVSGKDSEYWFDVILTMGINVGYEYLRAFADMGEGSAQWNSFVAASGYKVDGGTYTEADLKLPATPSASTATQWEAMVDYIVDWALTSNDTLEWCWAMGNIVDTTGLDINLATVENPWKKLDHILDNLLPIDEIISVDNEADYRSGTELEKLLRYDLILGIVDLRWDALINLVRFDQAKVLGTTNSSDNLFRKTNVLDSIALLLKSIVNGLLKKANGGSYKLIPDAVTDFDTLATQNNLKTLVTGLIGVLYDGGITNKFANTLLPFLNFLLGWKTDPQIIRDMVVWTTFRDGNDYAFQWTENGVYPTIESAQTQIHILNNSAGMLETHRNSSVTDHAYDIEIKSITSDATVNTLTFDYGDGVISPFETLDVKIGGKYNGEEAATITIAYDYVGKNGQPIGERQYMTTTILFSNQFEDANVDGRWSGDDDDDYTGTNQYKKFVFTEDLYTSVTTYEPTIFYVKPTINLGSKSKSFTQICANGEQQDCNGNITKAGDVPQGQSTQYFEWIRDQNEAGWEGSISDGNPASGRLYKAKSGVTANTEFPYGDYDMGNMAVQYGGTIIFEVNFIYYNDYDIGTIYDENVNNNYHANQGVAKDLYDEYIDAWNDIVYYAKYPMMTAMNDHASTAYVTTIQPKIPDAIERFEAAKEAYEAALAEADASGSSAALPSYVVDLQAEIDNDFINKKEINFQDYNFYEYFNYNDVKVEAEELYRTYLAPEVMDSFYINGSGIREAELNLVIGAEANSIIAAGIEATKEANDQAAIDASQAAKDEWKMPTTSKLVVDDFTSRLSYYKTFLEVNAEPMSYNGKAAHLYFLEKEIAFVEAQGLNEADYTEASWAAYAEALDIAKKVAAGNDPEGFSNYNSRIYDVKYNLMVAYKNLLLGDNSLIEQGGTADLNANIAIANEIFASLEAGDGVWMLAEDYEGSEDDAYAALIRALGYEYQAMYSENDIEVEIGTKNIGDLKYNDDGSPMMFNLYAGSALEYANNDRPNRQGNQAKVDTANAALEAAIANFQSAVSAPELIVSGYGEEMGALAVKTDMFDEFVGVIFGIDTYNGEMIADYLETSSGSIEIIPTDLSSEDCPGTGSIINLLDDKGDIVESYVFILFGDANGDGFIDSVDAGTVAEAEVGLAEFESFYYEFAADYDGSGYYDSVDAGYVAEFEVGLYEMSQAEIAAEAFVNYGF